MIKIKTGNLYKNAGIIGLLRILEGYEDFERGKDYIIDRDSLSVKETVFEEHDFGTLFMDTLISKYDNTPLTRWIEKVDAYKATDDESRKKELKGDVLDVRPLNRKLCWTIAAQIIAPEKAKKLVELACKAACMGMLRSQKQSDVDSYRKRFGLANIQVCTDKNIPENEKIQLAYDLREWLRDKECFAACQTGIILKDIITKFWYIAPLFKAAQGGGANVSAEIAAMGGFAVAYNEAFTKKLLSDWASGKLRCVECGAPIKRKADSIPITFTTNIWSDTGRKTSAFWNHNVEAELCPLCALVYSCAPLGFNEYGQNYIFINCNSSVDSLNSSNAGKSYDTARKKGESIPHWFNKVVDLARKDVSDSVIGNIQVAVMQGSSGKYKFESITASSARIIAASSDDLNVLAKANLWIVQGNVKVNVYEQVANRILSLVDLYDVMDLCIKNGFAWASRILVNIQTEIITERQRFHEKEVCKMTEMELKEYKKNAFGAGRGFRKSYMAYKATDDARCLNAVAYPLLNNIKCSDGGAIYDILLRIYNSMGKEAPGKTLNLMTERSEEAKLIGYAFVSGMLSEPKEKKDEQ